MILVVLFGTQNNQLLKVVWSQVSKNRAMLRILKKKKTTKKNRNKARLQF